jgi:hypothetical protein
MAFLDQADQTIQANTDSAVYQFRQYLHSALRPQSAAEPLPPSLIVTFTGPPAGCPRRNRARRRWAG